MGFPHTFTHFDIILLFLYEQHKILMEIFFSLVPKAYVVVPLPFWQLLDTYIHFGNRNENVLKFLKLRWEKKCQVVLHYLSTSHHQGLGKNSIVLSNKFLE
jgi:hypothetical protein